jgi:hypothetical protein
VTEPSSWSVAFKWAVTLVKKALPDRILRLAWPSPKLLQAIEVFHFDQAPRFYVRSERGTYELSIVGFNVFNFSPFKVAIVGADLRISVDGMEWLTYIQRMPTEIPMTPYARSGFHFSLPLGESQIRRLRDYRYDWTLIRVSGDMIVKSTFGELRKAVLSDVVTLIDRDDHALTRMA